MANSFSGLHKQFSLMWGPAYLLCIACLPGVKGAVCGLRGTYPAGVCVRVRAINTWEMPFIPAKSYVCMSSPWPPKTSVDG